jgi:hypothetical protein
LTVERLEIGSWALVAAFRFKPRGRQKGLKSLDIAGQTIDPATDDFYQRLIIHRNAIKDKLETASETDKPALESDEQAIKILANATSYGIFVELNVDEYVKTERMVGYGGRTKLSRVCGRWEPEAARACPSWWS